MEQDLILSGYSINALRNELRARQSRQKRITGQEAAQADEWSGTVDESLAKFDTTALSSALVFKQKAIYGVDDRRDYHEFAGELEKRLGESVTALFRETMIRSNGDGTSSLLTVPLSQSQGVCSGERFATQPTGAFCTGFLVGPDVIATAGHCINAANVATVRFVFGFRMTDSTTAALRISDNDIYAGREILGWLLGDSGEDWALVRVDRTVNGRDPLQIRKSGRIPDGASVFVMGHPSGLPLKFADGSEIRDNSPEPFFIANLDTYGGNSGSPVFSSDGMVEGILVRGETDYVMSGSCFVSLVCPTTGCGGEHCTRITEVVEALPA